MLHNVLISKLGDNQYAPTTETMINPDPLRQVFQNYPEIIRNTEKLMNSCSISFDFTTVKNKKLFTESANDDKLLLEKLELGGMMYRYGKDNQEAKKRIAHELKIIDSMGFSAYFLITWDIIRYCRSIYS